jgi:dCMP deaminase
MNKYDKTLLKTAYLWAEESICKRLKVGAIIAKESRIISIGFNGTPQGLQKKELLECDYCIGNGFINDSICPKCGGTGFIEIEKADNDCESEYYECLECNSKFTQFKKEDNIKLCPNCNNVIEVEKEGKIILKKWKFISETNPNVIHAEMNALMFAAKQGISTNGATMYVTHSPCINCAKHILQAGIKRLVYAEDYRDNSGIELLKSKIKVDKIVFG